MTIGISMIMLGTDAPIRATDVQRYLVENWRDIPAASDIIEKDGTLTLQLGAANLILAKMPTPMPWSDLEGPCATSILWKNATADVSKHSLHWIATVTGKLDPLPLSKLLTQATAAAMAACEGAIGVYWANAKLVIPKNIFIDFAKELLPHGPPLHIWLDFQVGQESENSYFGFTTGMKALGHMELETQSSPERPGELRERFLALAGYLVENGPVIRDGDTLGEDADERIRVVYSDSAFGNHGKVMRLVYETVSTKKPWWKLW
jgi:Domain of unknown function (DUF4261)